MIPQTVTKDIYRGSRPNKFDMAMMESYIRSVICLEDNPEQICLEMGWCEKLDINFVNIQLTDKPYRRPLSGQLRNIVSRIQAIQKPVLIHCRRGIDRTGYAIAAYRMIVEGWSFGEALKECCYWGHNRLFYVLWQKSLIQLTSYPAGSANELKI